MDAHPPSYWRTTLEPRSPTRLRGDVTVDVAVVGGGFTGLATALELRKSRPDLEVAVLEAHTIGYGASGRNGGFAMTLFGLTLETTAWRFGRTRAAEALRHTRRSVRNVVDVVREEGIDCDLEETGMLVVANCDAQMRRLEHETRLAESIGAGGFELWDRDRLSEEIRSPLYRGARYDPWCALLNPWKLSHGLRDAAERHGARVYELSPVRAAREVRGGIELETDAGTVRAGKVVLATNAYSSWHRGLHRRSAPVFTYIVTTEPLEPDRMAAIGWRGRHGVEDARNLVHYYRLTADGRLLMGGGDVRYRLGGRADDPAFFEDSGLRAELQRFVSKAFPSLEGVRFSHHWGGPVSVPLDMAPAVGTLGRDGRLFYALGCVGHGVSLSVMHGKILRDLVLGEDTELSRLFFVNRRVPWWPDEPFRYPLAQTIREALRLQDWVQER